MSNIFSHKQSSLEVSLIHIGKMEKDQETVAIYEVEEDRSILVMPLNDFNKHFEQNDFSEHGQFSKHH